MEGRCGNMSHKKNDQYFKFLQMRRFSVGTWFWLVTWSVRRLRRGEEEEWWWDKSYRYSHNYAIIFYVYVAQLKATCVVEDSCRSLWIFAFIFTGRSDGCLKMLLMISECFHWQVFG